MLDPDAISAGAAVLAAVIAIGAFGTAHRQLRILRRQESDRQARERQADAAKIAVWVRVTDRRGGPPVPVLRYINLSGMPVYELTVWVRTPEHEFRVFRTVAGPSGPRDMGRGTAEIAEAAADAAYDPDWLALLQNGELVCASRFRDASNQWWLRDVDGVLSEATERSLPRPAHRVEAG